MGTICVLPPEVGHKIVVFNGFLHVCRQQLVCQDPLGYEQKSLA